MTDARLDGQLHRAIAALPPRSGIIVRHDHLKPRDRHALFLTVRRKAQARGIMVFLAGNAVAAKRWGADGVHLRAHPVRQAEQARKMGLKISTPVHDRHQAVQARAAKVDAALISPVFATRSHPDARAIGVAGFARLAKMMPSVHALALGGMTNARFTRLRGHGADGWAAIDAWLR